jgi:hypothetical protein
MSLHAAVHRVKGDDRAQVQLKVAAIADDLEDEYTARCAMGC